MIDNRTVGKTISTLRQARGMTQQQLAAAMNVSHQAVSKWENGAALPDIQTLVELTQLFGITVEQLLSGEIPEEETTVEENDSLGNIGKFVSGVFSDLGNALRPEKKEEPKAEPLTEEPEAEQSEDQKVDLQRLLQMAPFMSKGAIEEMLRKSGKALTAAEIARFAPFVSSACLEELIESCESEITWETLRRVAPFLKKEVVDAFARAIALGEKYVRPATRDMEKATDDMCRSFDEMSRKIGKGVDKAVRKAVRFGENVVSEVSKAFDNLTYEPMSREERRANMRRSVFEKALEEEKWDWIEAHTAEVQDDELRRRICEKANGQGMQEWVARNFGMHVDEAAIDLAVAEEKWDWLGQNLTKFSPEMQRYAVAGALDAQNWTWLQENADQIELDDLAVGIAKSAYEAGEKMLAVQMARYNMLPDELEAFAGEIMESGDFDFIDMISDVLQPSMLADICAMLAGDGKWDAARRYIGKLDDDGAERLMQLAIDAGNFDIIDALDVCLKNAEAEEKQQ